ncbi:MAG TPA: 30S ribosomal protein S18 [Lentisphaeria bacterium]|jgi:small subunit ribosomal protein S18|nr:30S ribosomal protein S18 [Lentisphaeria bacterium]
MAPPKKRRRVVRNTRPKVCRFCEDAIVYIDYRDNLLLRRFITEKGKIVPRRVTGTCPNHQKMLSRAIKRARSLSVVK